jgi:hypothetical protein
MSASITAAKAAPQEIFFGKYHQTIIVVKVLSFYQ